MGAILFKNTLLNTGSVSENLLNLTKILNRMKQQLTYGIK